MQKGYVDDGNGGGYEEVVDRMIGKVTEVDGQLYISGTVSQILDTLSLRPKFMAMAGETDNMILAKMGKTVLGYDVITFFLTVDIASKKNKAKGFNDHITKEHLHHQEVGAQCHLFLVRPSWSSFSY